MKQPIQTLIITGGAGFIGSALIRLLMNERDYRIVNLDKLTYAGNLESLGEGILSSQRHIHVRGDIADAALVHRLFDEYEPVGVIHLAAESHVDRSIDAPGDFVHTSVLGTFTLLHESRRYHQACEKERRFFCFLHVSTDEVFGSLELGGAKFTPVKDHPFVRS